MSSNKLKHLTANLCAVLIISGCGATAPKITESDILAAERNGTLPSLYAQIKNGSGLGKSLKAADKSAYLTKIGTRLASQTTQKVLAQLNQNRLSSNEVPMSVIHAQRANVEAMKVWDKGQYDTTVDTLNQEQAITQNAIDAKMAGLNSIDSLDIVNKYHATDALIALQGEGNQGALEQSKNQMLSDAYDYVDQLISNQSLDKAIDLLKQLVSIAPSFRDAGNKLSELENVALQDTFVTYVNDGETQKADDLLKLMANGPYFASQRSFILPSAMELANYYVAMAVEATSEENLVDAYRLFLQSRSVKSLFGNQHDEVTQEADFIDFVYQLYEEANSKKRYGLALGYLYVIEQFSPQFPEIETFKRLANDNVMDEAIKRVSTTVFKTDDDQQSLGRSIASKITQYVFDTLPQDVRVVEREQLNAVLREQEISALQKGTGVQLDSADLLIQGTVLEADVERSSHDSSKKQRVVTERKQVNNPAYSRWSNMSSSERSKTTQPARTITKEIKEDISIKVTNVRKVAVLSISYGVVDARSATLIYADSVQDKKKVSDQTIEGVQLGEFVSEYKVAELPSDSELLSELTSILAKRIGVKVVAILKDPEIGYKLKGEKLYDERNYVEATQEIAKSLVMTLSKNKEAQALTQMLREYAVTARLED